MNEVIRLLNVSKTLKKRKILNNISLSVNKGDILGIIGPNGSGKTTILKAILSLIKIDQGTIIINGITSKLRDNKNLKNTGSLIEQPGLYPYLTGLDHLKMFASDNVNTTFIKKIINLLEINSNLNKYVKSYSLGTKQKLGIVLSLLNSPSIVLLDEPTNALDIKSKEVLNTIIKKLALKNTTFIIASHDIEELAMIANRFILIRDGKLKHNFSIDNLDKDINDLIFIITNDNQNSCKIIKQNKIKFFKSKNGFLISQSDIETLTKLLKEKNISIIKIGRNHIRNADLLKLIVENKEGDFYDLFD